jgi:adenylate cyclase class 2
MSQSGREIEAKFYVRHLDRIMTRLQDLEARLIQPRVLEINLRFDLPDDSLRSKGQVLRLRRDTESKLTYKGSGQSRDGVLEREEIEFMVDDFEKARQFLEALGYRQSMYYEKYRSTYEMQHTLIMVDELPYGDFVEIEGENVEAIHRLSDKLGLRWNTSIDKSYTALFEIVRQRLQLSFNKIAFEQFEGISVTADDLHVHAADE